jgi:hypothetical protein
MMLVLDGEMVGVYAQVVERCLYIGIGVCVVCVADIQLATVEVCFLVTVSSANRRNDGIWPRFNGNHPLIL